MRLLGNTYEAVLNDAVFSPSAVDKLKEYLISAFDSDEILAIFKSPTDSGEYATGKFYLLEDEDDIDQMMLDTGCGSITQDFDESDTVFDMAMYLDDTETLAMLMSCTSDSGGDIYIVPPHLFEDFPSIREHIFESNR